MPHRRAGSVFFSHPAACYHAFFLIIKILSLSTGYDDGKDYRQNPFIKVPNYTQLIYPNISMTDKKPIKIGILKEGIETCDKDVTDVFLSAIEKLKKNDYLETVSVSLSEHVKSAKYMMPIFFNGSFGCMLDGCGHGVGVTGNYVMFL